MPSHWKNAVSRVLGKGEIDAATLDVDHCCSNVKEGALGQSCRPGMAKTANSPRHRSVATTVGSVPGDLSLVERGDSFLVDHPSSRPRSSVRMSIKRPWSKRTKSVRHMSELDRTPSKQEIKRGMSYRSISLSPRRASTGARPLHKIDAKLIGGEEETVPGEEDDHTVSSEVSNDGGESIDDSMKRFSREFKVPKPPKASTGQKNPLFVDRLITMPSSVTGTVVSHLRACSQGASDRLMGLVSPRSSNEGGMGSSNRGRGREGGVFQFNDLSDREVAADSDEEDEDSLAPSISIPPPELPAYRLVRLSASHAITEPAATKVPAAPAGSEHLRLQEEDMDTRFMKSLINLMGMFPTPPSDTERLCEAEGGRRLTMFRQSTIKSFALRRGSTALSCSPDRQRNRMIKSRSLWIPGPVNLMEQAEEEDAFDIHSGPSSRSALSSSRRQHARSKSKSPRKSRGSSKAFKEMHGLAATTHSPEKKMTNTRTVAMLYGQASGAGAEMANPRPSPKRVRAPTGSGLTARSPSTPDVSPASASASASLEVMPMPMPMTHDPETPRTPRRTRHDMPSAQTPEPDAPSTPPPPESSRSSRSSSNSSSSSAHLDVAQVATPSTLDQEDQEDSTEHPRAAQTPEPQTMVGRMPVGGRGHSTPMTCDQDKVKADSPDFLQNSFSDASMDRSRACSTSALEVLEVSADFMSPHHTEGESEAGTPGRRFFEDSDSESDDEEHPRGLNTPEPAAEWSRGVVTTPEQLQPWELLRGSNTPEP
ncbi:unnamed protein product [Chrysoparadoxa australica]